MTGEATTVIRVAAAMVTVPATHGPDATVAQIRRFFDDDHVQLALVVGPGGRLITTIERADLPARIADGTLARTVGTLTERTARPTDALPDAAARLRRGGRRRLAVVDPAGRLVGLLCGKRSLDGFCSDDDVRDRACDPDRDHDPAPPP